MLDGTVIIAQDSLRKCLGMVYRYPFGVRKITETLYFRPDPESVKTERIP